MSRILSPLTAAFRLGVTLRNTAYRRGWLTTRRLNRPVVSIGNLTLGGTGKTPLVAFVARTLLQSGWKPSILTRGYGRRLGVEVIVLEPGSRRDANAREVGDEPTLLARALPEVPIVVCADRYRGGRLAEERFKVDAHLLDDGFQHLALWRDVDVVVLDVTQEFSDRALLPAGRLREPCSAVERAHLVVLTRVEQGDPVVAEKRVAGINPGARIFRSTTRLSRLLDLANGSSWATETLRGQPVYAFCGIGNPRAFFRDLERWGFSAVGKEVFPDHHVYSTAELAHLSAHARQVSAVALLTTEKDAVNLPAGWQSDIPVVSCVIQTEVCQAEAFVEALLARLQAARVQV